MRAFLSACLPTLPPGHGEEQWPHAREEQRGPHQHGTPNPHHLHREVEEIGHGAAVLGPRGDMKTLTAVRRIGPDRLNINL